MSPCSPLHNSGVRAWPWRRLWIRAFSRHYLARTTTIRSQRDKALADPDAPALEASYDTVLKALTRGKWKTSWVPFWSRKGLACKNCFLTGCLHVIEQNHCPWGEYGSEELRSGSLLPALDVIEVEIGEPGSRGRPRVSCQGNWWPEAHVLYAAGSESPPHGIAPTIRPLHRQKRSGSRSLHAKLLQISR